MGENTVFAQKNSKILPIGPPRLTQPRWPSACFSDSPEGGLMGEERGQSVTHHGTGVRAKHQTHRL